MKKTLLIAAAALVAGVISSEAQVYSANIVGYVNVTAPAGAFVLTANPLTTGDDVLSNVVQNVPGATSVDIWNGTGFSLYTYSALSHSWKQGTQNADNTPLPPGVGFFLKASSATNITFVGNVVPASGSSVTNVLGVGLYPVGSLTPYADVVTNAATFNLQVAGATTLQQWSIPNQQFALFTYSALSHTWKQGSTPTNPVINVAEGFFISPSTATNWVQTLQ
jgi:hypothetical protein